MTTVGILGGGQLGRMDILAGRPLGLNFHVYEPGGEACPAACVADKVWTAPFDDVEALVAFAQACDVVTLEFENIPVTALEAMAAHTQLHPAPTVLATCQHRQREKEWLAAHGFPVAPFAVVESADALTTAVAQIGTPCVLKTAAWGYDGKGQQKLTGGEDLAEVWTAFDSDRAVLEGWVSFSGEYSVICARNARGDIRSYPLLANEHRHHILHRTAFADDLPAAEIAAAQALAEAITEKLGVVGLLTVELFHTANGWVVNELAPRPHNSGHLTTEASRTSQFAQHMRAVTGLPLGDPAPVQPAVMINLLGDVFTHADDPGQLRHDLLALPGVHLHLYGKAGARPGRKMGHATVTGPTPAEAQARADALVNLLEQRG